MRKVLLVVVFLGMAWLGFAGPGGGVQTPPLRIVPPIVPSGEVQTCSVRALFVSPARDYVIEQAIAAALDAARDSILIAMFSLSDQELTQAVIRAHLRGVRVRVLLDGGAGQGWGPWARLLACGIPVLVEQAPGLMHHKFAVIDHRVVITGSYDWTEEANERNCENVVIIDCPGIARAFAGEFERLWALLRAGRIP